MMHKRTTLLFSALALTAGPALAQNQAVDDEVPLVLDPSGRGAAPADDYDDPAPPPTTAQPGAAAPGTPGADGQAGAAAEVGYYYADDLDLGDSQSSNYGETVQGPVPETHVVRSGDTLWDLCAFYFSNPWEWPKVWSYNPTITNPHWIYPGDIVRLYPQGPGNLAPVNTATDPEPVGVSAAAPSPRRGFSLTHTAFVDAKDLDSAYLVEGAVEDKMMLAQGDSVYIGYPKGKAPTEGKKYSVYDEIEKVIHPQSGEVVGAYVRIRGDIEVRSVKKDRRARGTITRSTDVIERGQKVGPIKKYFDEVQPTRNEKSLQGVIVGSIGRGELIGSRELVLIDLGEKSGLQLGNRLYVVRRGDAYPELTDPTRSVGLNDQRYPARALGEIIIVEVGSSISMGLVTLATKEIGVGDMVLMQADE